MNHPRSRILIIDDTPANLLTLGALLEKEFDLQVATSGPMGLALAEQNPPHLILLDIMMPGMNGFEVCQRLKAEPGLQHIPVIFVTALDNLSSEAQGLALGAVDYITKPFNVDITRQRIRNLLEREHLGQQVQTQRDQLAAQVTTLREAEAKLQLAASVFNSAREAIMITTVKGEVVDVNQAFTHITGYSREEVLGKNPRFLSSGVQHKNFYATLWRDLSDKGHWYGEIWNRHKNGNVYAAMQTISTVHGSHGQAEHYLALFSDITASKNHQMALEHIAHYDALTNLPNRALLADRLHQAMAQSLRRDQLLAVAYLDLDGFKTINDQHGHEAGDQMLIAVAARMKQALREGDTLARIGGDEFVAVLADLTDLANTLPMLTRLLAAAAQPIQIGGLTLQASASLGVTFYPQQEDAEADLLLRQADQAMYQAKLAGKNRYHLFDAEQDRSVRGHHESLKNIRLALQRDEFVLHYQPKVNLRTGKVVGAEALIRWQHPEQGLLPPSAFLPVIEDHPLAIEVGEWVINTALTQIGRWQAQGFTMPVSVNVGAHQLQHPLFTARLQALLAAQPALKPGLLELEVLETSALADIESVSLVIKACGDMGVMFALDDFGTGYSSLSYLKRLKVKLLKIDQSFVRDMLEDPDDLAILKGVIGLAAAFRRQVIAEGVETLAHGRLLLELGCELAQGYGIARAMPAQDLPAWTLAWQNQADWATLQERPAGSIPDLDHLKKNNNQITL